MTYEALWQPLVARYGQGEAKAIALMVLDVGFGLSRADVLSGRVELLSDADGEALAAIVARLLQGEPVQYVLGVADFGGRTFAVGPGVLIPRPETAELCQWVVDDADVRRAADRRAGGTDGNGANTPPFAVLDIGTGSGCIACTLAAEIPGAAVTAWDISPTALDTALRNAERLGVGLTLAHQDLRRPPRDVGRWDAIVSNPPYVLEEEAADMEPHVLEHEPREALFAPQNQPLALYRAIAAYALRALKPGGSLYLEINPRLASETTQLLFYCGFRHNITLRDDAFGRHRMIKATLT